MISLTFDTDHCDEVRMREFLAEEAIPGRATFFCTQRYECIGPEHEVGPHVVLESLAWDEPLDEARATFPEAQGFRSHGCLSSHGLAVELAQRGYRYLSAHDEFGRTGIAPRRESWGIWHLPIYYADNLDISFARHWGEIGHEPFATELLDAALAEDGLYVFAFHPVHVLLNTTSVDSYLEARDEFVAGAPLEQVRCEGYGVLSYYRELLELLRSNGVESTALGDAVSELRSAS